LPSLEAAKAYMRTSEYLNAKRMIASLKISSSCAPGLGKKCRRTAGRTPSKRCPATPSCAAVVHCGYRDCYCRCRSSTPLYSLSGRISAFASSCSMMCAVQPVMRLATNRGVKVAVSKPIKW
jgi:hypothetical protein